MKIKEEISKKPILFMAISVLAMLLCIVAGFFVGFSSGMDNYVNILDENDIICIEKDNPALPGGIVLDQGISVDDLRKLSEGN